MSTCVTSVAAVNQYEILAVVHCLAVQQIQQDQLMQQLQLSGLSLLLTVSYHESYNLQQTWVRRQAGQWVRQQVQGTFSFGPRMLRYIPLACPALFHPLSREY